MDFILYPYYGKTLPITADNSSDIYDDMINFEVVKEISKHWVSSLGKLISNGVRYLCSEMIQ